MFATASLTAAATKFDHAEYMKPKTEGQKKDDHPVKGSISFDKEKKTVEFVDEKGVEGVLRLEAEKNRIFAMRSFSGEVAMHISRFVHGDRSSIPSIGVPA